MRFPWLGFGESLPFAPYPKPVRFTVFHAANLRTFFRAFGPVTSPLSRSRRLTPCEPRTVESMALRSADCERGAICLRSPCPFEPPSLCSLASVQVKPCRLTSSDVIENARRFFTALLLRPLNSFRAGNPAFTFEDLRKSAKLTTRHRISRHIAGTRGNATLTELRNLVSPKFFPLQREIRAQIRRNRPVFPLKCKDRAMS